MALSDLVELRLLRCALSPPTPPSPLSTDSIKCSGGDGPDAALSSALLQAMELIERGAYAEVLAIEALEAVLGKAPAYFCPDADPDVVGKTVYNEIERNARDFVTGREGRVPAVLVMAAGVASLFVFVQANFTGPQDTFPVFPMNAIWNLGLWNAAAGQMWETWARLELMVDGCDIIGKCAVPQYLLLANIFFRIIEEQSGPASHVWWVSRALMAQQRVLDERSPTLLKALESGYSEVVQRFGSSASIQNYGWHGYLAPGERDMIAASAYIEAALMKYHYGHADDAGSYLGQAERASGLKYLVEGALGYRNQHQVEPTAQRVLKDEAELDVLQRGEEVHGDSDVLLAPRLVNADKKFLHQKVLSTTQQATILVRCLDVKKRSGEDELRSWDMAPFVEAVDAQQTSSYMVKAWCRLLRVEWEKSRGRTRERAFLTMEGIVADIRGGSIDVTQRMQQLFCVPFPCIQALFKKHANMLVGFGVVGEALKLFEELELWHNLIDCHRLLGDKARAASLIRERLEISPRDPRLWCSLGDVIDDDKCFLKSWEVSGQRFAPAQRCLARSAYNRKDYAEAVHHWDMALSLNSLYSEGWFSLGFSAIKANQMDKALDAFVRTVQLDPDNGEAWNNIAALNMRKEKYEAANVAFEQALKYKRNSWETWENYAQVSFELGNYSKATEALGQVFELSRKHVDLALLGRLMEVVEERKASEKLAGLQSQSDHSRREQTASSTLRETENLIELLGRLISKVAVSGDFGGEIWGLKARWHKAIGELDMCFEAHLKQVRALQGSNWQHDKARFQAFAAASLQLCKLYLELACIRGGKRELSAAQLHLRSTLKQAHEFEDTEEYKAMQNLFEEARANLNSAQAAV